jgi:hypothetical protein
MCCIISCVHVIHNRHVIVRSVVVVVAAVMFCVLMMCRQATLLTLLPQLPPDAMPSDRLLRLAEAAEFHTICELIHRYVFFLHMIQSNSCTSHILIAHSRNRDWKAVIRSRLADADERRGVFGLIDQLLSDKVRLLLLLSSFLFVNPDLLDRRCRRENDKWYSQLRCRV